jgi:hypothetical protein
MVDEYCEIRNVNNVRIRKNVCDNVGISNVIITRMICRSSRRVSDSGEGEYRRTRHVREMVLIRYRIVL